MTQLPDETTQDKPGLSAQRKPHAVRALVIVLFLLLVAGGFAVVRRVNESRVLARETEKLAIPTVATIHAIVEPSNDELMLPAQLQAYVESPIYSRTNGYLLRWYKDMGSHVRKGERLADIDTPEIDQELSQARAARDQISAQLELAKSSAERWLNLRKSDSVSQQEADQQVSAYNQAKANLAAAEANVRRLEQLESFKHIDAPFSGVLTQRNTDTGALINAGSTSQTKGLFNLAQVDPLRVYVSVPQMYAPTVHATPECPPILRWRSIRDRNFPARSSALPTPSIRRRARCSPRLTFLTKTNICCRAPTPGSTLPSRCRRRASPFR